MYTEHCCINRFGELGVAGLPQGNCTRPHRLYRPSGVLPAAAAAATAAGMLSPRRAAPSASPRECRRSGSISPHPRAIRAARLFSSHLLCKRAQSRRPTPARGSHIQIRNGFVSPRRTATRAGRATRRCGTPAGGYVPGRCPAAEETSLFQAERQASASGFEVDLLYNCLLFSFSSFGDEPDASVLH